MRSAIATTSRYGHDKPAIRRGQLVGVTNRRIMDRRKWLATSHCLHVLSPLKIRVS